MSYSPIANPAHVYHDTPLFRATLSFLERNLPPHDHIHNSVIHNNNNNRNNTDNIINNNNNNDNNNTTTTTIITPSAPEQHHTDSTCAAVSTVAAAAQPKPGKGYRYCDWCSRLNHVRKATCAGCSRPRLDKRAALKKRKRQTPRRDEGTLSAVSARTGTAGQFWVARLNDHCVTSAVYVSSETEASCSAPAFSDVTEDSTRVSGMAEDSETTLCWDTCEDDVLDGDDGRLEDCSARDAVFKIGDGGTHVGVFEDGDDGVSYGQEAAVNVGDSLLSDLGLADGGDDERRQVLPQFPLPVMDDLLQSSI